MEEETGRFSEMKMEIGQSSVALVVVDPTTSEMVAGDLPLPAASALGETASAIPEKPASWYQFDNVRMARGYNWSGIGRGAIVSSNIFLSTALIYLAEEEAGCVDDEGEVIQDCDGTAYGFQPASFVTSIAVIASVLSALFMPLIGAMVDYTKHRRAVGSTFASLMIAVQTIQIGTTSQTWVAMVMLQAISGFLYQGLVLSVYAYLPEMSYRVGEETMTKFTSIFMMTQFTSQGSFLLVVAALSLAFDLGDVVAAQVSQSINVVWSGVSFFLSWRLLEPVPARHVLPDGHSLLTEGFIRVYKTARDINQFYKHGTRWFFLALTFAEAGSNAFTVVSVVFLHGQLGLSFIDISIFFLVSLVSALPGSLLGAFVTRRLDPKRSWQLCMTALFVWTAGGAIILDYLPSDLLYISYLWGCGIGVFLGWYYPTENLFFCMCLPKGQEAELAGFYVYCSQILGWLPPLIFSFIVEAKVSQTYGVVAVASFLLIAVALVGFAATWDDILRESGRVKEGGDLSEDHECKETDHNDAPMVEEEIESGTGRGSNSSEPLFDA